MSKTQQAIPTQVWRTLTPIMFETWGIIQPMWKSLISGKWSQYDLHRERLDALLKMWDDVRKIQPEMSKDDQGWDRL